MTTPRLTAILFLFAICPILVSADEPIPAIAVTLLDADGKPCSTGYIRTYPDPRPADWEGDQPRNFDLTDGKCSVPLANFDQQRTFKIVLYPDGFAPYELRWLDTAKEPLPTELTFKMPEKAAAPIGGRVVDPDGKPVAGAYVEFSVSLVGRMNHPDNTMFANYAQWIKTDADGYWIYQVLPKDQFEQNFDMSVTHDDYPRLRISEGQTFKDFAAKNADGKFAKTIVLPKGLPLKGKVVDEQGKPIVGALLQCNAAYDQNRLFGAGATKTDENGEFVFENCLPKGDLRTVDLGICHGDFAPDVIVLTEITSDMEPLNIVMKKGRKIILKAVDPDGKPLEGMRISPRNWMNYCGQAIGTRQMFVGANEFGAVKTGTDGRFVWENAPDSSFDLEIDNNDYQNIAIKYDSLKYGDEENVYVFKPLIDIAGTVSDAETGEAIPSFNVTEWFTFTGSSGLVREFGSQSAKDGKFTRKAGQRFGEFDNYYLRVEADGYDGLRSEDLIAKSGTVTLEFKLKKTSGESSGLAGTVLQPDGKPAGRAKVEVITHSRSILLLNGRFQQGQEARFSTDNEGRFKLRETDLEAEPHNRYVHPDAPPVDYLLIFLHDSGFKRLTQQEWEALVGNKTVTLEPWGRVKGTIKVGTQPGKNLPVQCWISFNESFKNSNEPHFSMLYDNENADESGKFLFNQLPSGFASVGRRIILGNGTGRSSHSIDGIELKPGATATVTLGGVGRPIIGKLSAAKEFESQPDWTFATITCTPTTEHLNFESIQSEFENLRVKMMPKELREETDQEKLMVLSQAWNETEDGKNSMPPSKN